MIEQDQSGCFCSVRKACACLCSLQSKQIPTRERVNVSIRYIEPKKIVDLLSTVLSHLAIQSYFLQPFHHNLRQQTQLKLS